MFHGKQKNDITLRLHAFSKTNFQPHQSFTGSYKKCVKPMDELQDKQNIES